MPTDFFLFDTERLHTIASDVVIKQGFEYFADCRVFSLEKISDVALIASVEDAEDGEDYQVELSQGDDATLKVTCCCHSDTSACKHAIAALYQYADQSYRVDDAVIGNAVDEAIAERVKKGHNEVRVMLISGNYAFGVWQASSIVSSTHWQQTYHVHIRSLEQRINYCTCPDLASNRLGTCKHIEAAVHYARTRPGIQSLKRAGSPVSFVYLSWESATLPVVKLSRKREIDADLAVLLATFFDQQGYFVGRIPEDVFRLAELTLGRDDFQIGEDALRYARQCADDAMQAQRGQHISREILRANGLLPGVKVRLFPYQSEGVAFLAARGRALLADDMGLGKTLQAISAATWLADNEGVAKVLIVTPASLKQQWAREIEKFTNKTVQIVQGGADERGVHYRKDALFFIVNYELVPRDLSVISQQLKPDLVILDEAQRIKNWRTKLASTVKLIPSRYVFVLSGTPLENRIEDLYSLLQLVDARVLGPLWRCLLDFHITDERGKVIGYRNLSELRRRIAPVLLRRNRSLVSDQLPDRTEVVLDIPLNHKQQELHSSALSAAGRIAQIAKNRPLTPSEQKRFMAALQQARMACNAAGLVDKETQGSPKLDELARLLEDVCLFGSQKAVVFSQWALMTEMVEVVVRGLGLGCVRLHGGVPSAKRGELIDKFQQDASIQVFISTDAGGVGLNLQNATVLINLDMPWNPAVLDQRIARVHRLGQKHKVQIFVLIAEDSYEQQVAQLVKGKRDLFDNVINPDASEDVVGVSKKMLDALIQDLTEHQAHPEATQTDLLTVTSEIEATMAIETQESEPVIESVAIAHKAKPDEVEDSRLKHVIEAVQTRFAHRIERILARQSGLLVVVEQWAETDEQSAEELSHPDIQVAVIDARSLRSLQRLGAASPLADTQVLVETIVTEPAKDKVLHQLAHDKLHAAEVLLAQHCYTGVMDLLAAALLCKAAAVCGASQAPSVDNAAVWLFSDCVPKQLLSLDHANRILKVIALSHSVNMPETLLLQNVDDTRWLFEALA